MPGLSDAFELASTATSGTGPFYGGAINIGTGSTNGPSTTTLIMIGAGVLLLVLLLRK